jgi:DNA-binding cell septation regulator SpoVG
MSSNGSKLRAYADVTISFGLDGMIKTCGFSIFENNSGTLGVRTPSRRGDRKFFDVVTLSGRIRGMIEAAVVTEYKRVVSEASTSESGN